MTKTERDTEADCYLPPPSRIRILAVIFKARQLAQKRAGRGPMDEQRSGIREYAASVFGES